MASFDTSVIVPVLPDTRNNTVGFGFIEYAGFVRFFVLCHRTENASRFALIVQKSLGTNRFISFSRWTNHIRVGVCTLLQIAEHYILHMSGHGCTYTYQPVCFSTRLWAER